MKAPVLSGFILGLSLCSSAFAEFYLSGQVNANSLDAEPTGFTGAELMSSISSDNSAFGLGLGWQFSKNLAVEAHYNALGNVEGDLLSFILNYPDNNTDPPETRTLAASNYLEGEFSSFTPTLKILLPADESFLVFAKLGIDIWQSDTTFTYSVTSSDNPSIPLGFVTGAQSDKGANLFMGFGGVFNINKALKIFAEYDVRSFKTGMNIATQEIVNGVPTSNIVNLPGEVDIKINSIVIGVEYHFVNFVDELFEPDF